MHNGRDQMRWAIMADLNDELTEVGLDDFKSSRFQRRHEIDLLADHRLALDAALAIRIARDFDDDALGIRAVARKVNLAAVLFDAGFQLLKVKVEIIQGVLLDLPRELAQRIRVRQIEHP